MTSCNITTFEQLFLTVHIKMKYISKTLFILFALLFSLQINAQDNVVEEIVWVVGDEAILKSEVEAFRREMLLQNTRIEGDPYCFIPEQIAVNKLYLDQSKLDSIEVDESNVNRMVEYYVNEYVASIGSIEKLEEYMGQSIKKIRDDLKKSVRENQLISGVQQKHFGDIVLAPSEISKYYQKIPQDSLPFIPTTVEMQIITMEPKIPLAEIDKVKARLRDFTEQINTGKNDFSTLALLYSEDPGSAIQGGELGFKGRGEFVQEFSNVAFSLNDPKKVSNIVETEYGYHIIQLIERRGDKANFRHILLKPNVPKKELDSALVRLDSIKIAIDDKKFTFEEAATYMSADKNTRNNKGIMVNPGNMGQGANAGTPRFALEELNPDISRVIGGLNVGDVSQPFIMTTSMGEQVAAIIKLTKRNEGHKANLNTDYQIIKSMAENNARQKLMDEWIKEKIKNTYVRIDPAWKGCDFKYKGWLK